MFDDYDPRDHGSRNREDGIHDREDQWLVLGRGPGAPETRDDAMENEPRDRDKNWREARDRDARGRDDERGGLDPRDVFMRDLDLPDGRERELVHDRDREYSLDGSDTRALSTIGAFRVVPERDLRDPRDTAFDNRGDLRHLEKQGLIERLPLDGRDRAAVLTNPGPRTPGGAPARPRSHGQKTTDFLRTLVERGYARPIEVGARHRGRLFHLCHKPLYAAVGQADNRHRRRMPLGRMIERLMVLDAVLADRTFRWLGTESDKRSYFMRQLQGRVELREFPRLPFGAGARSTTRYFPDKLPIGVQHDKWDEHVFLYLVTSPVPMEFRLFLLRHGELLRSLLRWRIGVLVPEPFARAIRQFGHAAREQLATPIPLDSAAELEWFFRERQRRQEGPPEPPDDRFRRAVSMFRAPRFRALYCFWQQEGNMAVWTAQSHTLRDALARQEGRVEFVRLAHQYFHLASLVGVA